MALALLWRIICGDALKTIKTQINWRLLTSFGIVENCRVFVEKCLGDEHLVESFLYFLESTIPDFPVHFASVPPVVSPPLRPSAIVAFDESPVPFLDIKFL